MTKDPKYLIAKALASVYHDKIGRRELTLILLCQGGATAHTIAKAVGSNRKSINAVMQHARIKGFVQAYEDPETTKYFLTEKGQTLVNKMLPQ